MEALMQAIFLLGTLFSFGFGILYSFRRTRRWGIVLFALTILCGIVTSVEANWLMRLVFVRPYWLFLYVFTAVNIMPVMLFLLGALAGESLRKSRKPVPTSLPKELSD